MEPATVRFSRADEAVGEACNLLVRWVRLAPEEPSLNVKIAEDDIHLNLPNVRRNSEHCKCKLEHHVNAIPDVKALVDALADVDAEVHPV